MRTEAAVELAARLMLTVSTDSAGGTHVLTGGRYRLLDLRRSSARAYDGATAHTVEVALVELAEALA